MLYILYSCLTDDHTEITETNLKFEDFEKR